MVRGTELSSECRAQAVILRKQGLTYQEIAQKLRVSLYAAYQACKRYRELGTYRSRKRSGRPRVTTPTDDRAIRRVVLRSPKASSLQVLIRLPKTSRAISTRTIRRRLFSGGLKSYTPAKKPKLSQKNIKDRLAFCQKYQHWSAREWERVMFSDESTFTQFYSYCRHVRRPSGKRYDSKYMVPRVKQAPKVMVWGSVSAFGRGGLWFMPQDATITGAVYLQLLKDKLPTFMNIHNTRVFQHDGAPCHQTKAVSQWLQQSDYEILGPWPGNSPDLNVIENVWIYMKRRVAEHNPTSSEDLMNKIRKVWACEIKEAYCLQLVHSMPDRIAAVLANKGGHTKY
jgi:hypothetical protein